MTSTTAETTHILDTTNHDDNSYACSLSASSSSCMASTSVTTVTGSLSPAPLSFLQVDTEFAQDNPSQHKVTSTPPSNINLLPSEDQLENDPLMQEASYIGETHHQSLISTEKLELNHDHHLENHSMSNSLTKQKLDTRPSTSTDNPLSPVSPLSNVTKNNETCLKSKASAVEDLTQNKDRNLSPPASETPLQHERLTMRQFLMENNIDVPNTPCLFETYSLVIGEAIEKLGIDTRDVNRTAKPSLAALSSKNSLYQKEKKKEVELSHDSIPVVEQQSPDAHSGLKPFTMIENYFFAQEVPTPRPDQQLEWLTERSQKLIAEKIINGENLSAQQMRLLHKLRINLVKEKIWSEFRQYGYRAQFHRDAHMWHDTLQSLDTDLQRKAILTRIFTVIRHGGLLMKPWTQDKSLHPKWKFWRSTGFPIATALSHGSRIIIQLNKAQDYPVGDGDSFWNWLITGDPHVDASTLISTCLTSQNAHKENKILFKRLGATHSIDYFPQKMQFRLPANRMKIISEVKTLGLTDSKVLANRRVSLLTHAHWGMNIPMGGLGKLPLLYQKTSRDIPLTEEEKKEKIDLSGKYGHLYMYYLSPTKERFGGLLIGCEGSEPGVQDALGENHGMTAASPLLSPTFGYKWFKKRKADLRDAHGPAKYNSMLIDLSTGWKYLMRKHATWKDEYVKQRAERPCSVPARELDQFLKDNVNLPRGFNDFL